MASSDNSELSRGESVRWNLEKIEIESMAEVPLVGGGGGEGDGQETKLKKKPSNVKKRNQVQDSSAPPPRMGRMESRVTKSLMSLRFLDRTVTGLEEDAWKAIDKRFHQNAVDGKLFKDKFGVCIGILLIDDQICLILFFLFLFNYLLVCVKGWEIARNSPGSCSRLWRGGGTSTPKTG